MTRSLPSLLLSFVFVALLSSPALAGVRGKLVITVDRPIAVLVDGEVLEFEENSTAVEVPAIEPGRHLIEFRNFFGKLVGEGEVRIPTEARSIVRARWSDKTFEVYDTVLLEPAPADVVVVERTTVVQPHDSVHVSASLGGVGVSASVDAGVHLDASLGGVMVVESHGAHVHDEVVVVETVRSTTPRLVTFRVTDDESLNLWIDGKRAWGYHVGKAEKALELTPGEHRIELKDFLEERTLCSGQLYVDGDKDLIVGLSQGGCVDVFSDPTAFARQR